MMVIGTEAVVQKARLSAESVIIRLIFRNPVTVPDWSLTDMMTVDLGMCITISRLNKYSIIIRVIRAMPIST